MGRRHAVVVGAGHNGLTAANVLADAGWRVTVFEADREPGGAVRSAELAAPGFQGELGGAFYPLGMVSPALRALRLEEHGLVWRHAPVGLVHALADGRCAVLSRDVDQTAASLAEFATPDGPAWHDMYRQWQRVGLHVLAALLRPFPPVRPALGLLRALGSGADVLRFARWGLLPVRRMGEERFTGEGGRLLLAGNAMHGDLGPQAAGSGLFGWMLAMLGQQVGYPVPEGGAARLTAALVDRLASRGGRLVCGCPVARIELRHGRAVGVRLDDGTTDGTVEPADAVLADVAAPALYHELVGMQHLPARLRDDLRRFQWDHGTVKLDWALSAPIPWTARPARGAAVVHVGGEMAELSDYAGALGSGRLPDQPFVLLGQLSTVDPSRAPEGMASVWAYTHVPWRLSEPDGWLDEQVRRVEEAIERRAPGFRSLVVGRHVAGPEELFRADRNLVSGAVNGGTAALHQQLVFRPVPGLARAETPVPGLYLAGASAHPGGGVHGACGGNAAAAVLAGQGTAGPARRAGSAAVRLALRRIYRDTDGGW
ncbi:MAG TPA: NAD(P)/FAD-dependent oxidoreductase [Mycobacteriales bacterium]|nr:NAD(P)/FAD-dependent oxidoreductase [Mycobacteriales bacterium]